MNAKCAGKGHRQDGEDDETPAECSAKLPFAPCRGTLWKTQNLAEGGPLPGNCLQDGEPDG